MQKGQVGFTQKDADWTLLWRAAKAHGQIKIRWHGYGTVGEGNELYLIREGVPNSVQELYIPPSVLIGATWCVVVYDAETGELMNEYNSTGSEILSDEKGVVQVYCQSDGAEGVIAEFVNLSQYEADNDFYKGTSVVQVKPVVHREYNCIEMVISDFGVTHTNFVCVVELRGEVLDISAEGMSHIPAGGTSTITREK